MNVRSTTAQIATRAALALVVVPACGLGRGVADVGIRPASVTPVIAERLLLPQGAQAAAVWAGPEGGGVIALRDGRFLGVDPYGQITSIDRVPGEFPTAGESPVSRFGIRGPNDILAIAPGAAMIVQRGLVLRAELPMFLSAPRAFSRFGAEALWGTADALYATDAGRWMRLELESGALADITDLVPIGAANGRREAWVQTGATVRRVRYEPGPTPQVAWGDAAPGIDVGAVRAIAALDDLRGAIASDRGVIVAGPDYVRLFRSGERGVPDAIGGGGGWAWVVWGRSLLRTDGERWENVVTDDSLGANTSVSVNSTTGTSAFVIDSNGGVSHVETTETLWLSGVSDGAFTRDTRIALEAVPVRTMGLNDVTFYLDGTMLVQRMAAPWGWGTDGVRTRDVSMLRFGTHQIEVAAHYDARELRRIVRFDYVSPIGRTPSYAADIAPLFTARCARCHANGIARNLTGYDNLSAQAPIVRSAVRENRMPPDVLLDPAAVAMITAWVDGNTPP